MNPKNSERNEFEAVPLADPLRGASSSRVRSIALNLLVFVRLTDMPLTQAKRNKLDTTRKVSPFSTFERTIAFAFLAILSVRNLLYITFAKEPLRNSS